MHLLKNRNVHESYYNKMQYESCIDLHYKFLKSRILVTKYPYNKAKLRYFCTKCVLYDTIRVAICFTKVSEMRNKKGTPKSAVGAGDENRTHD